VISIDHIGVPARDRLKAARFLACVFDLGSDVADDGRFAPVRVGAAFTIDFFDAPQFEPMHVAFVADDVTFDRILGQLHSLGTAYGSQPNDPTNGRTDHSIAGRGLYFHTPDGHLFEVMSSTVEAERT
jgi:catechol 2,3-dioxygenase-like lactoylglutathione lyase family enzyme